MLTTLENSPLWGKCFLACRIRQNSQWWGVFFSREGQLEVQHSCKGNADLFPVEEGECIKCHEKFNFGPPIPAFYVSTTHLNMNQLMRSEYDYNAWNSDPILEKNASAIADGLLYEYRLYQGKGLGVLTHRKLDENDEPIGDFHTIAITDHTQNVLLRADSEKCHLCKREVQTDKIISFLLLKENLDV